MLTNQISFGFDRRRENIALLEYRYGITAVGGMRAELLEGEFGHVGIARQGLRNGCRALRLLGWTESELDTLWAHDSNAEQCYVAHYGSVVS